jgi:hypothetical protein
MRGQETRQLIRSSDAQSESGGSDSDVKRRRVHSARKKLDKKKPSDKRPTATELAVAKAAEEKRRRDTLEAQAEIRTNALASAAQSLSAFAAAAAARPRPQLQPSLYDDPSVDIDLTMQQPRPADGGGLPPAARARANANGDSGVKASAAPAAGAVRRPGLAAALAAPEAVQTDLAAFLRHFGWDRHLAALRDAGGASAPLDLVGIPCEVLASPPISLPPIVARGLATRVAATFGRV